MIAEHLSTSVMMEHMRQWLHLRDEGSYCVFVMPSIAAFIHGLLSEDMYATGMIQRLDERYLQDFVLRLKCSLGWLTVENNKSQMFRVLHLAS